MKRVAERQQEERKKMKRLGFSWNSWRGYYGLDGGNTEVTGGNVQILISNVENLIEAEAIRRERQAVRVALEGLNQELFFETTQPNGQFTKDAIIRRLDAIEADRLAELKSQEEQ